MLRKFKALSRRKCVAYALFITMTMLLLKSEQRQPQPQPQPQQIQQIHLKQQNQIPPHAARCKLQSNLQQRNKCIEKELLEHYANPHDRFVNHHQYTFTISSTLCANRPMHVVFCVHSKPSHYHQRMLIRTTYGSVKQYQGKLLTVVFLLGAVTNESAQNELKKESETFGDMVQGNFIDSYRNLSLKHVMGMHWFTKNCKADFVMKLDDDTFVNPYRLLEFLAVVPKDEAAIYCKVSSDVDTPDRNPFSRTYIPYYQYPFEYYPSFCLGFAYITTTPVWSMLYETSSNYKPLYVDDVFVTGILASVNGLARKDIGDYMYECQKHLNLFDLELLRQSVAVLDRRDICGNLFFFHWRNLSPHTNLTLQSLSTGLVSTHHLDSPVS